MMSGNIILMSLFLSLLESDSNTGTY